MRLRFMVRLSLVVVVALVLIAMGYTGIFMKTVSLRRSLESLNATVITSKINHSVEEIKSIKLHPDRERRRNFQTLRTASINKTLVMFDATDCSDFGDQELKLLSQVTSLEYLIIARTNISDISLATIANNWSNLQFLAIDECNVSEQAIEELLTKRKLKFIRISASFDTERFQNSVKSISPDSIVMCNGKDLLGHPPEAFEFIRWGDW